MQKVLCSSMRDQLNDKSKKTHADHGRAKESENPVKTGLDYERRVRVWFA